MRSVQVHDRPVERAAAGQRVALSLPGVERSEVHRGDALVAPASFPVSYRLDVTLAELEPIADGARLSVHHGTSRVPARVASVGERWAQLRLSDPVVAARGDRVVLRTQTTVGGGTVLDPAPPRHRDPARMERLERGDIAATIHEPIHLDALRHVLDSDPRGVERAGPWAFSAAWRDELERSLRARIERADPLDPGVPVPAEPWAADVVPLLTLERRGAKLYLPGAAASLGAREAEAQELERRLSEAGVAAVKVDDAPPAASPRPSNPYAVVLAGLAALEGTKHGGATARVEALWRRAAPRARLRGSARRTPPPRRGIDGFGHPLYPDGDPRAALLLDDAAEVEGAHLRPQARRSGGSVLGEKPNLDFALVAVARALDLPRGAALALFAIGRTIGWIAHAIEQYAQDTMIRPRAKYVGPKPSERQPRWTAGLQRQTGTAPDRLSDRPVRGPRSPIYRSSSPRCRSTSRTPPSRRWPAASRSSRSARGSRARAGTGRGT